jgi:hypothetical protein
MGLVIARNSAIKGRIYEFISNFALIIAGEYVGSGKRREQRRTRLGFNQMQQYPIHQGVSIRQLINSINLCFFKKETSSDFWLDYSGLFKISYT